MKVLTIWEKEPLTGWDVARSCPVSIGQQFKMFSDFIVFLKEKLDACDVSYTIMQESQADDMKEFTWYEFAFRTQYQKQHPECNQAKKKFKFFVQE